MAKKIKRKLKVCVPVTSLGTVIWNFAGVDRSHVKRLVEEGTEKGSGWEAFRDEDWRAVVFRAEVNCESVRDVRKRLGIPSGRKRRKV